MPQRSSELGCFSGSGGFAEASLFSASAGLQTLLTVFPLGADGLVEEFTPSCGRSRWGNDSGSDVEFGRTMAKKAFMEIFLKMTNPQAH